jgi:CheY-like chemotaxis protein
LLLDSNLRSRESRAKVMRDKGVQVDTVATADAARVRMGIQKYNLVLVDCGRDTETAETLVQEIRANNSRQLVGFLVGSPLFIARTLSGGNTYRAQAHATVPMPQKPAPAPEAKTLGQRIIEAEAEAGSQ